MSQPKMREIDGQLQLNPAGIVRWIYEFDEESLAEMKPDMRPRVEAFQRRVRARIEAHRIATGAPMDLQCAIEACVGMEGFRDCIRRKGDLLEFILNAGSPS